MDRCTWYINVLADQMFPPIYFMLCISEDYVSQYALGFPSSPMEPPNLTDALFASASRRLVKWLLAEHRSLLGEAIRAVCRHAGSDCHVG